jgi:hypothetical protein
MENLFFLEKAVIITLLVDVAPDLDKMVSKLSGRACTKKSIQLK